jgi:hypothetical protein
MLHTHICTDFLICSSVLLCEFVKTSKTFFLLIVTLHESLFSNRKKQSRSDNTAIIQALYETKRYIK